MKGFVRLMTVVVTAAVFIAACSKDKDSGKIMLDSSAVFFAAAGGTETVTFSVSNIKTLSVTSKPAGWSEPTIDLVAGTLVVTAPSAEDIESGDAVRTGSFSLSGTTPGGSIASATLFAGIVSTEDLSEGNKVANSYIATQKETNYLFDAMRRGDGSQLATDHVGIVWQSKSGLLQYLDFEDGKASFYVGADSDNDKIIKRGNAIVGAYDADGVLLWSWHVWVADYNPDAEGGSVDFNGYTMMSRNLGALDNDTSSSDKILASYGLYYQWGRKDPFIGPDTYQASQGASATMYSGTGGRVYLKTVESSAETGTAEYAVQNPVTFIHGTSKSGYDWRWSEDAGSWSPDDNVGSKRVNDPCPYGWRVAPSAAFKGLAIKEPLDVGYEPYYDKFGWTLTDGASESLFIGAGRRIYRNISDENEGGGSIQNFYPTPVQDKQTRNTALYNQPWVGYYWTTLAAAERKSSAFYFWFNKSDVETSGVQESALQYRSNGMQVRCVKVRTR